MMHAYLDNMVTRFSISIFIDLGAKVPQTVMRSTDKKYLEYLFVTVTEFLKNVSINSSNGYNPKVYEI